MRIFVYKVLITVISLFFLYQFTIGYSIYSLQQNISTKLNKEFSEKIKNAVRQELSASLKKDRILNREDAILLKNFISKIKSEINNAN
tara:strand:+ start:1875 stop:2138 length:264 start_codon:yes stop_codon:yes gene_type:complete